MTSRPVHTLALDLEGTLVSDGLSIIPRPGLYDFLEFCNASFPRVVLFTTVPEEKVWSVTDILTFEGATPAWFRSIIRVRWTGKIKDVAFADDERPDQVLLVDDTEDYIHPDQYDQWLPVKCFEAPYPGTDRELLRLTGELKKRLALT